MTNVLWADDDSDGLFRNLPLLFSVKGCSLRSTISYSSALQELEAARAGGVGFVGLLADVILPRKEQGGAIARDLGVSLARRAIVDFGISRVSFLTVVPHSELTERISALREIRSGVLITCFDKTVLLERDMVSEIVRTFASESER